MTNNKLKRGLSFLLLTAYGLGTILGAGIYVLVGKIASVAGIYAPLSFLLASIIAFFSAISFAELSARLPLSAGPAVYVQKGFQSKTLGGFAGYLVMLTGIVSCATLAKGFVGYLNVLLSVSEYVAIIFLVLIMTLIAAWGIVQSALVSAFITVLEVFGLVLIIAIASPTLRFLPLQFENFFLNFDLSISLAVINGAFIAFYAYIGFEDMVNVAEEVKNPEQTLPKSIFFALGIATVLYMVVSIIAIVALPIHELQSSDSPFADIVKRQGYSPIYITIISLCAIINGALVQIIMASRILYGMANQKIAPALFKRVNKKTKTPIISTFFVAAIVLTFALWLPLVSLAKITSFIILIVFFLVNVSLVLIKMRHPKREKIKTYSIFFPITGAILTFLFLVIQLF